MTNKKGNRLSIRTRKALIQAYIELLHEAPVKNIKITEICERAGLSRPTFYKHFQTKEEILESYLDSMLTEMFTLFRELKLPDFSNFESSAAYFFNMWQSEADVYRLIKESCSEHILIDQLKKHHLVVYETLVSRRYTIDDPEILGYFISHLTYVFYSALDHWMSNGMKRSPEAMGKLLADLYDASIIAGLSEKYNAS